MINSAGVNFGRPNEDFIIESDGNGAITSARNAVTGDEYVGGGAEIVISPIWLKIYNDSGATRTVGYLCNDQNTPVDAAIPYGKQHATTSGNEIWAHPVLTNNIMAFTVTGAMKVKGTPYGCTVEAKVIATGTTTFLITLNEGATSAQFRYETA